jgi:FKBP-type peptidyl-prolyl cis-trans isomerase
VDLDQMTELDSGVYIRTLVEGEGIGAEDGAFVEADYTLWLPDGTEVQSGNLEERLAPGEVIDGFRLGMIGTKEGETRLIVIPSQLGYGASGRPLIPPHSVLVFRVTLNVLNPPM